MQDASLREQFGWAAKEKMKTFEGKAIAKKFYRFITQHSASNQKKFYLTNEEMKLIGFDDQKASSHLTKNYYNYNNYLISLSYYFIIKHIRKMPTHKSEDYKITAVEYYLNTNKTQD